MQTCNHAITVTDAPWVPLKPGLAMRPLREIVGGGEIIGPGDFIFEPPGNVDSWMCHGDEACVIQISLTGKVEYLAANGSVESYSDSGTARAAYLEHCEREGRAPDPRILGRTLPAGP